MIEWRNGNTNISYPLKTNSSMPPDVIVDACIFAKSPIKLTRVYVTNEYVLFYINNGSYFQYVKNNPSDYMYNDFGKVVVGPGISRYLDKVVGYTEDYDIEFEDSVCYGVDTLQLMYLQGNIEIEANLVQDGNSLILSLPELRGTTEHDGLVSINGQILEGRNLIIKGDECTNVLTTKGQVILDDICLPPCYNCTERITTGDVHQLMTEMEDRVTELEP